MTLKNALTDEAQKTQVVADCLKMIDEEVGDKRGISGVAVKAGYKAVKGIKPGFVKNVVEHLLPEFADALEPLHQEATSKGAGVGSYFQQQSGRVADALLAVTDGKAEKSTNGLVKTTYKKLRGSAKKNVEQAVPRLGALVERYA